MLTHRRAAAVSPLVERDHAKYKTNPVFSKAVVTASVLSDRFCIATGKDVILSMNQLAGCVYPKLSPRDKYVFPVMCGTEL